MKLLAGEIARRRAEQIRLRLDRGEEARVVEKMEFGSSYAKRTGLDKIHVTARSSEEVVEDLELSPHDLSKLVGCKVFCAGEGASSFAQFLEQSGAVSFALDRLYAVPVEEWESRFLIADIRQGHESGKALRPWEVMAALPDHVIGGDVTQLPIKDAAFDRVYAANVLQWFLDGSFLRNHGITKGSEQHQALVDKGFATIRELYRVLKPGGELRFNINRGNLDRVAAAVELLYRPAGMTWTNNVLTLKKAVDAPPTLQEVELRPIDRAFAIRRVMGTW